MVRAERRSLAAAQALKLIRKNAEIDTPPGGRLQRIVGPLCWLPPYACTLTSAVQARSHAPVHLQPSPVHPRSGQALWLLLKMHVPIQRC
jgi:hypothetical protein